jgi:hypothetical protein
MTNISQTEPPPPSPDTPAPNLLRDLLDPGLTSIEVAQRHDLGPIAFRDAVQSQAFREAAEALRDADLARTELLAPLMHARALHTLARIADQPTTTPSQTESARRACTALLKAGRHAAPALRGADSQSSGRAQPEPLPPTPAPNPNPNPNPLADITGDPTLTLEDSLRLIAEIDAIRRGTPMPPPRGADFHSASSSPSHTPTIPPLASSPPTPAAQLMARAGAAP